MPFILQPRQSLQQAFGEVVETPSSEILKTALDKALSSLIHLGSWPCSERRLDQMSSIIPFQSDLFDHSVTFIAIKLSAVSEQQNYSLLIQPLVTGTD